jgi:hypothetical protein
VGTNYESRENMGMRKSSRLGVLFVVGILVASPVFGQGKQPQVLRRPPAVAVAGADTAKPKPLDDSGASYILDGLPVFLALHHDTEVGTNKPVDVFMLVIEMQVMNSDGNLEPVGLQIHNYYTRYAQDPKNAFNPYNAHDCKRWFYLQNRAMKMRNPKLETWPYIELVTAVGARVIQTNEDGQVWWSDDIQCWGSADRFPPF